MSDAVLGWLALLVILASTVEWFRRAQAVALEGSRTPFLVAWALGAGAGIVALMGSPGAPGGFAAGGAACIGLGLLGLVAISRQQAAPGAVQVGERLRAFSALDEHGERFALSGIEGRPILLKFFRGHW